MIRLYALSIILYTFFQDYMWNNLRYCHIILFHMELSHKQGE